MQGNRERKKEEENVEGKRFIFQDDPICRRVFMSSSPVCDVSFGGEKGPFSGLEFRMENEDMIL